MRTMGRAQAKAQIDVHRRAVELLSEPKLSKESLQELRELRHRIDHGDPDSNKTDVGTYVPYPWMDEPGFDEAIMRKREFYEHRMLPVPHGADANTLWQDTCAPPDGFKLTPSQLFTRNFVSPRTPYNGLLLFHGVGVGKTCSAITIAEQFPDRRVLVLTRPALQDGFRNNIYDVRRVPRRADGTLDFENTTQCTGTTYSDRVRDRHVLTPEQFEARVARLVRARYTFMGPTQFNNLIDSYGDGDGAVQRIRARFSDSVIVVDEAHHLRGEDNRRATPALRRVLELSENVKLVLLTATPMFNSTADLVPLINLLRVNDKARPLRSRELFDATGALTPAGEGRLRNAARGYVSYMRGEYPFSFPLRLTPAINQDPLVLPEKQLPLLDIKGHPIPAIERTLLARLAVCGSPMGKMQLAAYIDAERRIMEQLEDELNKHAHSRNPHDGEGADADEGDDDSYENDAFDDADDTGSKKTQALHSGQQICNLVYPVTSGPVHGKPGFDNIFRRIDARGGASRVLQFEYKPGAPQFLSSDLIADFAPKLNAIVQRIMRSKGIVVVYSRWVWSGLVPMAIALEHAGLSRLDAPPMVPGATTSARNTTRRHRWSYAIISGERTIASDDKTAVDKLRSPENTNGEVVKVVLMSDKGSEGLDLRYVREVHIMEPWYHLNKVEQVVGRASRNCSHIALPLAQRNVTIYLHAAMDPRPGPARETVDLRAYRIAQRKQENISRVDAVLRDSSVDCSLNAPRLYYPPGTAVVTVETSQGKKITGYKVGDADDRLAPRCAHPLPKTWTDESTYDVDAHAHHMQTYGHLLRTLFTTRTKVTYEGAWQHVVSHFKEARKELMSLALDALVRDRTEVINARGRLGHVVYRGNAYLFQADDMDTEFMTESERSADVTDRLQRMLVLPSPSPVFNNKSQTVG